jgi:hypothetical protein
LDLKNRISIRNHPLRTLDLKSAQRLLLAGCLSLVALLISFGNWSVSNEQQYVFLASSFLDGQLYFGTLPSWHDTASYAGRHYWPLGPLPAVIIMPFVFLSRLAGAGFYQGYISLPISLLTGWLCFRLARKCGHSLEESAWLTLAFCGCSSYLGVAMISMSWSLGHVVAVCLVFLSLHEWLGRRRWWLVGYLAGLAASARLTAGLNIMLFIATALFCGKAKTRSTLGLVAGFAVPLVALALYNFARFNSFIETGYSYQLPAPGDFPGTSLANVVSHLRVFLLGTPTLSDSFPFVRTNPVGMSVLLISPWLLCLTSISLDRLNGFALASCGLVLLAVLAWRSTGQLQVGYRFSLDFLPLIIFILARGDGNMGGKFKTLVLLSFLSSLYFHVSFIQLLPRG